jgi:hypothetical protein
MNFGIHYDSLPDAISGLSVLQRLWLRPWSNNNNEKTMKSKPPTANDWFWFAVMMSVTIIGILIIRNLIGNL